MRLNMLLLILVVVPTIVLGGPQHNHEALKGVSLEDLAWLTGYWRSDERGVQSEECWLAPTGSVMIGLQRDYFDDGRLHFEYLRIMETPNGVVYYATPKGYETTKFTLTAYTDKDGVHEAVFENPDHDFPKLIRYSLLDGRLTAEAEGIDDGQSVVEVWTWERAEFPDEE